MPDDRPDPLADLFTLFATPLSGTVRSIEQFRKGVDEFLRGVENFNRAMENLNETTERINSLVADVEQPLRAAIPQVTRTVKAADEMMQVVSGPAMAVAPGLSRLAETLSTPAFAQLPNQIGTFSDVLAEVSKRLGPLAQFAESAGGLFGGFRIPGGRPASSAPSITPEPVAEPEAPRPAIRTTTTVPPKPQPKPQPERQAATKTSTAKTSTSKTSTAKKSTAKKSTAKKSAGKKQPAKKSTAGR
jgi:ABC-type transporter Mla subunit MlaD